MDALRATLAFDALSGGRYSPESRGGLTETDFAHAVECGLLFSPNVVKFDHGAASSRILSALRLVEPKAQVELFLASLSTRRLDYRVGLGAYAALRNLPDHEFTERATGPYYFVCGLTRANNALDRNSSNSERFSAGGVVSVDPLSLAFYLECQAQLRPVQPAFRALRARNG